MTNIIKKAPTFIGNGLLFMGKQYFNVLFNGFQLDISEKDKKTARFVATNLAHFDLSNQWKPTTFSRWIQDSITGDLYLNEEASLIQKKCAAVFFGTLILHSVGLVLNAINRILKWITLAHFWVPSPDNKYHFTARIKESVADLLRVVFTPLIFVGLLLFSLYGASYPNDGRKGYASLARIAYKGGYKIFRIFPNDLFMYYLIAPCFQPEAAGHAFGGSLRQKNQW